MSRGENKSHDSKCALSPQALRTAVTLAPAAPTSTPRCSKPRSSIFSAATRLESASSCDASSDFGRRYSLSSDQLRKQERDAQNRPVIEQWTNDALHGLKNPACMLLTHSFTIWAAFAHILLICLRESFACRPRRHRTSTSCEQLILELGIEVLKLPRKLLSCFMRWFYDI